MKPFDNKVAVITGAGSGIGSGSREQAMKAKATTLMRTTPAHCATEILRGIRHGKRRIVTGQHANLLFWLPRLFPAP